MMRRLSQVATINTLPVDLLEEIFLACVHAESLHVPPLLLSQVCRHWRWVAQRAGRLWTDLDMSKPSLAQHHLHLSQGTDLHVTWCKQRAADVWKSVGASEESTKWVYDKAVTRRLKSLTVHCVCGSPHIKHIVGSMGRVLPRLEVLILNCSDTNEEPLMLPIRAYVKLELRMPNVRYINLWHMVLYPDELATVLKESLRLESVVLGQITFLPDGSPGRKPDTAPLPLPGLRYVHLKESGRQVQEFFLRRFRLFSSCCLKISEYGATVASWGDALHPLVFSVLNPALTYIRYGQHVRLLQESNMPDKPHIQIFVVHPDPLILLDLQPFDVSRLRTLELDQLYDPYERLPWENFAHCFPMLSTLVLFGIAYPELVPRTGYPKLKEVWIVLQNLDEHLLDWDSSEEANRHVDDNESERLLRTSDVTLADTLLRHIAERNRTAEENEVSPITRVLLRDCWCKDETLGMMQDAAPQVEFVRAEKDSYARWEDNLFEKFLAVGPATLSASGSRCTAAAGLFEEVW